MKILNNTEPNLPTNRAEYLEGQAHMGLKPGDRVRILRTASTGEGGWGNAWVDAMDEYVGKILTVEEVTGPAGVLLECEFQFPYFVLEKCN